MRTLALILLVAGLTACVRFVELEQSDGGQSFADGGFGKDGDDVGGTDCSGNYVTAGLLYEELRSLAVLDLVNASFYPAIDEDYADGLRLFVGDAFVDAAPEETRDWVGGEPSAMVIFSINALYDEDPLSSDETWVTSGLLIRGATVLHSPLEDRNGDRLCATRALDIEDMNLVDADPPDVFQVEYAGPTDSELADQLVDPTAAIKLLIRELLN